jgi:hypothetical protein
MCFENPLFLNKEIHNNSYVSFYHSKKLFNAVMRCGFLELLL